MLAGSEQFVIGVTKLFFGLSALIDGVGTLKISLVVGCDKLFDLDVVICKVIV